MTDIDNIIGDIAQQMLRIETLATRKSDSLDFHDVSVWGLRAALLSAFEAGRQSARKKSRIIETGKRGTCYQATIKASYQSLVEVWGEPSKGNDNKTEAEWVVCLRDTVVTIYNYKNSRSWGLQYPDVTEVSEWHVGGHRADVVDRLLGMMAGRASLLHRSK